MKKKCALGVLALALPLLMCATSAVAQDLAFLEEKPRRLPTVSDPISTNLGLRPTTADTLTAINSTGGLPATAHISDAATPQFQLDAAAYRANSEAQNRWIIASVGAVFMVGIGITLATLYEQFRSA